jgi:hypothetical protein
VNFFFKIVISKNAVSSFSLTASHKEVENLNTILEISEQITVPHNIPN